MSTMGQRNNFAFGAFTFGALAFGALTSSPLTFGTLLSIDLVLLGANLFSKIEGLHQASTPVYHSKEARKGRRIHSSLDRIVVESY